MSISGQAWTRSNGTASTRFCGLRCFDPHHVLGVAVSDCGSLVVGEFGLLEEVRDVVPDDVREVLGVDDPLGADLSENELQLILAVHARRRRPHMFAVVLADCAVQVRAPADRLVESVEPARHELAPVTAEEFQARVTIQRPDKMSRRTWMPASACQPKPGPENRKCTAAGQFPA